jgi:DNA ligase 1
MQDFAELFEILDTTSATNLKVAHMRRYFKTATPADAAWATYLLSGRRLKRFIGTALLRHWLIEESGLAPWIIEETYASVGDLAETIALLMDTQRVNVPIPTHTESAYSLSEWLENELLPLKKMPEAQQKSQVVFWWRNLAYRECLLVNKFLTGAFRLGVSQLLVSRAIAEAHDIPRNEVYRRLMGDWQPSSVFWTQLCSTDSSYLDTSAPYPFFLASPLETVNTLGEAGDWLAEWKWDGIRAQLIRRSDQIYLWSRGEELLTERFPDITAMAQKLPNGTVLDGEILGWRDNQPLPFAALQRRIMRKKLTATILKEIPVRFIAYDILEQDYRDIRTVSLVKRREILQAILSSIEPTTELKLSEALLLSNWDEGTRLRDSARERGVEGLMLKALNSTYGSGRQRGAWWKWKIAPLTFDGVLLYAQPGHGRRANLYTDYTFGVWANDTLIPVAKAYSGLTQTEITELDRWIRAHTREKFGPVRAVDALQVFELAFEGIAASPRHKSGVALRFPRILRWRRDKPAAQAERLEQLTALL